jgi:hypothetical protein
MRRNWNVESSFCSPFALSFSPRQKPALLLEPIPRAAPIPFTFLIHPIKNLLTFAA